MAVGLAMLFVIASCAKPQTTPEQTKITNFEECVLAGNPVMESYPEQCRANGQTFINERQTAEIPTSGMPVPGSETPEMIVEPTPKISPMPANEALPPAVLAAKTYVEQKTGESAIVLQANQVDWPDGCIGIIDPAMTCIAAITPGYNITVHSKGFEYEIHTNEDGSYLLEAGKTETGAILI